MKVVAGGINKQWLLSLVTHTQDCNEVRAAVAYAETSCMELFEACREFKKPLTFYGRYDLSVPVGPEVIRWFLNQRNPALSCRMVPDFLHAKVLWWMGVGAYLGSANLTSRAWTQNLEAGVFMTEDELEEQGLLEDIRTFFDVVAARSHAIDAGLLDHLLDLQNRRREVDRAEENCFKGVTRYYAHGVGLASAESTPAKQKAYGEFQRRWHESLQVLRDLSVLAASDEYRPAWIPKDTPAGAQADQFVHAYYYKHAHGNRGDAFVRQAYEENRKRGVDAVKDALRWWKSSDFNYLHEERTLLKWAPRLRELLARDHLRKMSQEEFVEALGMVHAVIDYGNKRTNAQLGLLEDATTDQDTKVMLWAERLWHARTEQRGRTPLEMLDFVIWGSGEVEARIWMAAREPEWRIRGLNFSSLGEMVGWARPNDYPPRNDRTIKGLTCLGYDIQSL